MAHALQGDALWPCCGVLDVGAFFREASTVMEIRWNTYRAVWGQGFASEAAAAALYYALEVRREPRVRALIAPGMNHRSAWLVVLA